jgi:hypothetical protein
MAIEELKPSKELESKKPSLTTKVKRRNGQQPCVS